MSTDKRRENFKDELKNKLSQKTKGSLTEETVLLRAFKYFDLDNSGECSENEFIKTIFKIGVTSFSEDEIKDFFHYFDTNNSGVINYKEFANLLFSNNQMPNKKKNVEENTQNKPQQEENQEEEGQEEEGQEEVNPQNENVDYKEVQGDLNKQEYLEQDPVDKVLNTIREKLAARGVQGICSICRNFRVADDNNSQTIDYKEFKKACKEFQFGLNEDEMKMAFVAFDRDNTGEIDYDEFIRTVRGEMNEFRQNLVKQAFNKLDLNGNGEITLDELKDKYNAENHPETLNGDKSPDEVFKQFLDTFQDTYNYLCGTETDNKVTIEEFMEYYENVSMSIDNDEYFELLMNNVWKLNNDTAGNKERKGWSNKNEEKEEVKPSENIQNNYREKYGDRRPGQTEEEAQKEKEEAPLKKFRKEMIKRGNSGIIGLVKQFKIIDENGNKELGLYEFAKALKDYEVNLRDSEIKALFNLFDKNKSGVINYDEFMKEVRGPLNDKRKDVINEAFRKLDGEKCGIVELYDVKSRYNAKDDKDVKSGKKTEEEVYTDFVDTFQMNHDNIVGFRNKRVTLNEFTEYYNNISLTIPDDDYFVYMVQKAWKINPSYSKVTAPKEKGDQDVSYAHGGLKQKKKPIGAAAAPFGTDVMNEYEKENKAYQEQEKEEQKKEDTQSAIEVLRNILSRRGARGILSMKREFVIADEDNSKTIDFQELLKYFQKYKIPMKGKDIELIFDEFDKDKKGKIDYEEFSKSIAGEMSYRRKKMVQVIFGLFDKNKTGLIDLDEVRQSYNAANHPDVVSGKKTEDEVLAEFLDTFQYHFNLLNSNRANDGKISLDEFIDYYSTISLGIDDDDYFDNVLKSVYNYSERKEKKKGWKGIV